MTYRQAAVSKKLADVIRVLNSLNVLLTVEFEYKIIIIFNDKLGIKRNYN